LPFDLRRLEPLYAKLPEVEPPKVPLTLRQKLMWTAAVLLTFFVLGYIRPYGVSQAAAEQLAFLSVVLASRIGSIITAGIGPIVLASIILQLFVGAGIFSVDLSRPEGKKAFTGTQKLLAILLSFFEAWVFTRSYLIPAPGMLWLVVLQVAFGSILLMYLDEVVMKWGIGSGISLFIAGGVAKTMFVRTFGPQNSVIIDIINAFSTGNLTQLIQPLWLITATILVFLLVVFAEGIQVEIPITWTRAKGYGGRHPIKLLYLSNIPVILAAALFANIQLIAYLVQGTPLAPILGVYDPTTRQFVGGLAMFTQPPRTLLTELVNTIIYGQAYPALWLHIVQAIGYLILLTLTSVLFGYLWLELSGMGPKQIAEQLVRSGFTVPGFRRDPRVVEKVLERYIPVVAILGSAFVGALAAFTDIFGALASGMGILLAVDIVYRYYQLLMRERLFEQHPELAKVLG